MKPSPQNSNWKFKVAAIAVGLALQAGIAHSAEDDYVYRVAKGDTLIGLSARLLSSPDDWSKVARHNRLPNPNYIVPGTELRVPLALLKATVAGATVSHVQGDVKVVPDGAAAPSVLALGATLGEGAKVITGKDGYATLKLPDGSSVRVQSATEMQVERMRTYPEVGLLESAMRLIAGRVESLVHKSRPEEKKQTRHGVKTPLANLAVRGTEFRVTMDGQSRETRGEVLEGAVAVAADTAVAQAKRVEAGFGSVVDASKTVSDPVPLLEAPNVSQLAKLQERTILRFPLPPVSGARSYRGQVARDEAFNVVIAEIVSATPELRVTQIEDGRYYLRARAVDARGLEGRDSTHEFALKARPEPPLIIVPAARGKVRALDVEFRWAENTEAASYHLQIARDASFKSLAHEDKAVKGAQVTVGKLAVGDYFWRVASLRKNGDRGPFGDIASFALLSPPAQPEPPRVEATGIQFRWAGEPGQTFEFQLADNPKFAKPLLVQTLSSPEIDLPYPHHGMYYMRFRAIDPDGFVGPYTAPQRFLVPELPFPYSHPVPSLPLFTQ